MFGNNNKRLTVIRESKPAPLVAKVSSMPGDIDAMLAAAQVIGSNVQFTLDEFIERLHARADRIKTLFSESDEAGFLGRMLAPRPSSTDELILTSTFRVRDGLEALFEAGFLDIELDEGKNRVYLVKQSI